jgi:glycosyltransferase 2 family protein
VSPDRSGLWGGLLRQGRRACGALYARAARPGVKPALQLAMILVCLYPAGRQVAREWQEVGRLVGRLQPPVLLASLLALILASFFLPAAITAFTRGAPRPIGYRHSALAYFGSQPMKYLPGGFWILPGRVVLLRGLGHELSLSSAALTFEMTTQTLAAALVAAALAALTGFTSGRYQEAAWLILAASLAAGLLLLVAPSLARRLLRRPSATGQALDRLAQVPPAGRLGNLLLATLLFTVMTLLMGAGFYLLVVSSAPRLDPALLLVSTGVFSLAWLVGFLTPFSPGGIGVRESLLVLMMTPFMGAPQAVLAALLSRALSLAVELAFAAIAWMGPPPGAPLARPARRRAAPSRALKVHPAFPI